MTHRISRRDFVARAAAATGVGLLACSHTEDPTPDPSGPDASGLDHIVIVTMENRSFDHLLGWLPGADGKRTELSYRDKSGAAHSPFHLTDPQMCGFLDPNHAYDGGRSELNNGACDGWLTTPGNDLYTIGYYDAADLPFLGRAAPAWTVLDRYFCPILGPTYPNRIVSLAGQTDRLSNTREDCALPTIWDRLQSAGKTGLNYGDTITTTGLWGLKYLSRIRPMSEFFRDAANGSLPSVAYVDPDILNEPSDSYHPPGDVRDGDAFLARVYAAVTKGPLWSKTLLILTFDEWGGFFDHVPPTAAPLPAGEAAVGNDGMRGFRIPTILVSPFAKRGAVSSKLYDHASILRLIEWRWNLAPLTVRDAQANNLMDELDFTSPRLDAPAIDVPGAPFGHRC
jgi:phospholipase C